MKRSLCVAVLIVFVFFAMSLYFPFDHHGFAFHKIMKKRLCSHMEMAFGDICLLEPPQRTTFSSESAAEIQKRRFWGIPIQAIP